LFRIVGERGVSVPAAKICIHFGRHLRDDWVRFTLRSRCASDCGHLIENLDRTAAWSLVLATSFAFPIAEQQSTAFQTAEAKGWAGTCCGSCCHTPGLPWHSSVRIPYCLGQTSGVATFDLVAVADVVADVAAAAVGLVAAGRIVT
jgi:hypothetical protein